MITFTKVALPYGWLGNMSPHPVICGGLTYPTSEHLFQALRFPKGSPEREEIRRNRSPMGAKMTAKRLKAAMVVKPRDSQDLANMHTCLLAKLASHPDLRQALLDLGHELLVEDVSKRRSGSALFWGMARVGDEWTGLNHLGRCWMELAASDIDAQLREWSKVQGGLCVSAAGGST